ncbi:MAG: ABC transporter permease, partial [Caldilineae bacterium]
MGVQFAVFAKLVMLSLVTYVLAAQGTMLGGRTGVFNVAQEGIMLAGASVGFLAAYLSGSLAVGMLAAMALGGLFGLALAYFTTTLKMDQFVIGLALFFFGLGLSTLFFKLVVGVTLQPPLIPTLPDLPIPGLSRIPVLGDVLFNQNILVYFAILLSVFLYYLLY